jgi:glycosyltransferase involved in cell wall biosynthesis
VAEFTLVCVGLGEEDELPATIQALVDTRLFMALLRVPNIPETPDQYWRNVLSGLPATVEKALVVNIEVDVTLDILRLGMLLDDDITVALPLSLKHEISRPLMKPDESLTLSAQDLNHWLNRYAVGKSVELPLLAGYCGWINAMALKAIDAADDIELAWSVRRRGLSIMLSDEAFVDDSACPEATPISGTLPEALSASLLERHPYTALRHPLSELNEEGKTPPALLARGPGVFLHISHSWGGGLGRWISDFCAADEAHVHLVLKSVGTRKAGAQAFSLHLGAASIPLKQWSLTTPIQSTSLGSYEYREILREIQASFSVEGIVISTLIGHSLDVYDLPIPILHVLHDYYPWCPPLYATWEDPCSSCDGSRLRQCLQENPAHQFFGDEQVDWYLALRERFVEKVITCVTAVVAPSESVKKRWQLLAPALAHQPVTVIGHGLPAWELEAFANHRWETHDAQSRLHLVVLGVLSDHKGGSILKRLMPELLKHYRVTLLGTGEEAPRFTKHPDLTVAKWYQLPDLPKKLAALKPDLGLLLSTVPETFSYTLSELFAAGIPPVATRMGAFEDRIEEGVTGWLVSHQGEDLLEVLSRVDGDREALTSVREHLLEKAQRSALDMTKDYLALLPTPSPIDAARPLCFSVVADSGVSLDQGEPSQKALFVRPAAAYRLALFQFLNYSYHKTQSSPQISRVSRLIMGWLLRVGMRLSRPKAQ